MLQLRMLLSARSVVKSEQRHQHPVRDREIAVVSNIFLKRRIISKPEAANACKCKAWQKLENLIRRPAADELLAQYHLPDA